MNVGWVGLGEIGTAMVVRLRGAGVAVCVFARGQGLDRAVAVGATSNDDYVALASGSEVLVVCVYDDEQVRDVLFSRGALAALRPGSALLIHTTGSPTLAREVAERAPAGVDVIDATFSGGPNDAAEGHITIMAGGDVAAIERVRPALEAYASQVVHVGPVGHGQLVKLLNNLMFAVNLMHTAEVLRLAEELGFDTWTVADVMQSCSGASYTMGLMAAEGRSPADLLGNARRYMVKDVATALATARDSGLDVTAFAPIADYFTEAP